VKVDSSRAADAGLQCRPLAATVRDTWAWMQAASDLGDNERATEIGLIAERERKLLAVTGDGLRGS
jgi:hypothetical protein